MPYNSNITRSNAQALMPEDVSREIIQGVPQFSAVMSLARRLPDMSRKQRRLPVLASLLTAYFVTGDTGLKQTSKIDWANKYVDAEELAVIVPIPENVLDDTDYDIWGEIRPRITEAFGVAFDQAVLYGTNAPVAWPNDIVTGATGASHVVDLSAVEAADKDLYDAILGEGGTVGLVEEDGFMVNGHVASLTMRAKLRGLREVDVNGDRMGAPIFKSSMQDASRYELDGEPVIFPRNGAIDPAASLLISGDWTQLVYAMRQDITYKLLTEAVIQDATGATIFNLAQQDMVALRAVMRLGWQLPNPINRVQPTEASRYPFSVLVP